MWEHSINAIKYDTIMFHANHFHNPTKACPIFNLSGAATEFPVCCTRAVTDLGQTCHIHSCMKRAVFFPRGQISTSSPPLPLPEYSLHPAALHAGWFQGQGQLPVTHLQLSVVCCIRACNAGHQLHASGEEARRKLPPRGTLVARLGFGCTRSRTECESLFQSP